MAGLHFNKYHEGKKFHPKSFAKKQQIWYDEKEKKCENARLKKILGSEKFSFKPNTAMSSSVERRKRNVLAHRSRARAQKRKEQEKESDHRRQSEQSSRQQSSTPRRQQRSRSPSRLPQTPREQRIQMSKNNFVKSIQKKDEVDISNLLVSVESLFLEANDVFKQCRADSKMLVESLENVEQVTLSPCM